MKTILHRIAQLVVPSKRTTSPLQPDCQSPSTGLHAMLSFLMLIFGLTTAWGQTPITALSQIDDENGHYVITQDISGGTTGVSEFSGTLTAQAKTDGTFPVISGISQPLFTTATDATISNLMFKSITVSGSGPIGAICGTADGTTRIYNCGILPTDVENATNRSTVSSSNNHCGSLVGYLDGYARVINCFSYANVSAGSGTDICAGGLVGYNTTATMQGNSQDNFNKNVKTMVVNCMFYGDITEGGTKFPIYGGVAIVNNAEHKVNNYNYYCEEEASFDDAYTAITNYNYSWPVAKKYLTRFEIYRSILNSNRRLCTWWVNGTYKNNTETDATDDNIEAVGIAKWVLDLTIAPYPILKKWGKYYSTFDIDPDKVWKPQNKTKVARSTANAWEGKSYGTLSVSINGGTYNSSASRSRNITITDMDTLGYDYCARKIQLPYYNDVFGNPNGSTWAEKYGNNYHNNKVVTGWKITAAPGGSSGTFTGYASPDGSFTPDVTSETAWQDGFNFADRKCTNKDLYDKSGRVFAQGGYYYVPDGVESITIEAYWGDAVYLVNNNRYMDRLNNGTKDFYIGGKLPQYVGGEDGQDGRPKQEVKTSLGDAVGALTIQPTKSVYDQAIVLVGNYQQYNFHTNITVKGNEYDTKAKPFTIMSADFDFDNEPDFCFQAGMYNASSRVNSQPIRFDFLIVPDITMAIRTDDKYYGMRVWSPQGHFEVTETSYLYVTQFEYDERSANDYKKHEAPVILNGGEFTQIVSTQSFADTPYNNNIAQTATSRVSKTSYFLMGGKLYMKAFTPGCHTARRSSTRHCVVNAIGGEFPEFYLSGMFNANFYNMTDNPHAYLDGGKFGIVAGAGMESVGKKDETDGGNVTFKINHSWINEFYGGGINAARPVTGNIDVTIDNSIAHKYCGGPKLGNMSSTMSIQTDATGTIFDQFFGGGNGGTNKFRENKYDKIEDKPGEGVTWESYWSSRGFKNFTPFNYVSDKGYQAEFEFELLPQPNGSGQYVYRSYYYYAEFSKTTVAPVTNTITDCTFNDNFYGGGNLGAVGGDIISTLKGKTVVKGSAFGAGFSASTPSVQVHNKSSVEYTSVDYAGFIHDGSLDYDKYASDITDPTTGEITHRAGENIEYTWIHDVPTGWGISPAPTTSNAKRKFEYPAGSGNWFIYTPETLTGLGTVNGDVILSIEGTTEVKGSVFGGGAQSSVTGNCTVYLSENANVTGNVFGGGDEGAVGGSTNVNIQDNPPELVNP